MYKYKGKEYSVLDQIKEIVKQDVMQSPEILLAEADYDKFVKEKHNAWNVYRQKESDCNEFRIRKDALIDKMISEIMQTIPSVKYEFIPTGFFVNGEVLNMNEDGNTIMIQPLGLNIAFYYDMIKTGNTIITKPIPLVKYEHHTGSMIELYPIGYSKNYAIAFGSTDPIILEFYNISKRWIRTRCSVRRKIGIIKSAIFPIESDRIEIMKWVMKQQNK